MLTTYAVQATERGWAVTVEHTTGRHFSTPVVVAREERHGDALRIARRLAKAVKAKVLTF